jgi:uncharacterized membrane protein YphA (DoxX/SURF4 family)
MHSSAIMVNRRHLQLLRISIGLIYLWFGFLKFFHGYSPAENLAINTINKLCFGIIPTPLNIILLAIWEVTVGLLLLWGKAIRTALVLLLVHMVCTFSPLFLFPAISFKYLPYAFTLVGQYIMKNIIIICAALILWPSSKK